MNSAKDAKKFKNEVDEAVVQEIVGGVPVPQEPEEIGVEFPPECPVCLGYFFFREHKKMSIVDARRCSIW